MRSQLRLRVLLPVAVLALLGVGVGAFAFGGSAPPAGDDPLPASAGAPAGATTGEAAAPAAPAAPANIWAQQANDLCRETLEAADALVRPETPAALQEHLTKVLELDRKLLTDLAALPRPKSDGKRIDELLMFGRSSTIALEKALAAIQAQDEERFVELMDRTLSLDDKADAVARRLDAVACARDSAQPLSALDRALVEHRVLVVVLYSPDSALDRLAIREARAGADAVKAGFLAVDVSESAEVKAFAKAQGVRTAPAVLVYKRWLGAVTKLDGYADRETVAQAADNARA